MPSPFDALFERSAPLAQAGDHRRDVVPEENGRWPISLVVDQPPELTCALRPLTDAARTLVGPGHFVTGHPEAAHITLRALEPRRAATRKEDAFVRRCAAALERAVSRTPPPTFTLTGVTLTAISVMAQLEAVDGWPLMEAVEDELGDDASYERDLGLTRDIFYTNVIHLADDIADPAGLVSWVRANRRIEPVTFTARSASLVTFDHAVVDGEQMIRMDRWYTFPFAG
ncbi:hypothetical protein [Luteipulveratus halotolerans]|uniref:2'-5' RNA ligase n=1 Tax=Luteipulveratus halotolerans TaxID=1631356 RepID=A0A0L6CID3_9MICO|nr:hypothetical protein [Luteipulveratus halotolerans]KNX37273.1 hypothetical protein VV01_09145 [Luteipulveratus halotolerans]